MITLTWTLGVLAGIGWIPLMSFSFDGHSVPFGAKALVWGLTVAFVIAFVITYWR